MTIDELWQNLKPIINKIENKVDKLDNKVDNIEDKVDKLEIEVKEIKGEMHTIQDINMTSLIKLQMQTIQEIKKTNQKLDKYIQKNEVEHKKFEYQIADLEWKSKITK